MEERRQIVIKPEDFTAFLGGRMVETGCKTLTQFAQRIGLSKQLLSLLLKGERKPGPMVLKKLGLRMVYLDEGLPEPPSKKPPRRKP